jgi:uncharacterized protein (TIGR00296 family)
MNLSFPATFLFTTFIHFLPYGDAIARSAFPDQVPKQTALGPPNSHAAMATVEHCLYCFEALAADLEKRTPMTLYQVQASWADYPKGLEDGEGGALSEQEVEADDGGSSEASEQEASSSQPTRPKLNNPAVSRLNNNNTTGTSTPSSASSTSLAPSTTASTPASSTYSPSPSFTPIGIGRRTSQRSHTISESPLFVTWNKTSPNTAPRLRGCIGTFESQPLAQGLASYALTSALGDTRFNPVTLSELPKLEVSVTLLTDFETCSDPMDWELGVHGLKVSFYHHHKRYGATYLPDVAVEQGWTKEETLLSLMRKAGWWGRREKWREVGDLKVVKYQGKKESVDYEEYRKWKEWVEEERKTTES